MTFSLWENSLLGLLILVVIFWMSPGIKSSLQLSKKAESDWMSVFIPLGFVILFVFFLIAVV